MRRCLETASALFVLSLAASCAQEPSLKIVEGKTTKHEIRAFFGPPDDVNDKGGLIYEGSRLTPAQRVPLRWGGSSQPQTLVIFEFEDSGILRGYSMIGWPSP
jgi:hypothetical protein